MTLERPAKLNALSTHLETELLRAVEGEGAHQLAVVVTGGDRCSPPARTSRAGTMTPADIAAYYRGSGRVYEVFAGLPNRRWRRSPAGASAAASSSRWPRTSGSPTRGRSSPCRRSRSGSCPARRHVPADPGRRTRTGSRPGPPRSTHRRPGGGGLGLVTEVSTAAGHVDRAVRLATELGRGTRAHGRRWPSSSSTPFPAPAGTPGCCWSSWPTRHSRSRGLARRLVSAPRLSASGRLGVIEVHVLGLEVVGEPVAPELAADA